MLKKRPSRYSIDKVKEYLACSGLTLVKEEYQKNNLPIEVKVNSCGHQIKVRMDCIARGRVPVCPICKDEETKERVSIITEAGFKVLKIAYSDMEIECPFGHRKSISFVQFVKKGLRCSECTRSMGNPRKTPFAEITNFLEMEGYQIKGKYVDTMTPFLIECPFGHQYSTIFSNFRKGKRCAECVGLKVDPKKIKDAFDKEKYVLLTDKTVGVMPCRCPAGHDWQVNWYNFNRGRRCPECSLHGSSAVEIKWLEKIKKFYPSAQKKRFDTGNGWLEFDIVIEELNLAIEIDGLIWHSEKFSSKEKRSKKIQLAKTLGYQLIVLYEDELVGRENQVWNFLLSRFNRNSKRIYARNTTVKEISLADAKMFLDEHHIQGSGVGTIAAWGLFYNEQIVAVMSCSRHHRKVDNNALILNRLAFMSDITVVGGSSKLFCELKKFAQRSQYSSILSWSDNKISTGKVYFALGFTMSEELPLSYDYVKGTRRFSKQSCMKSKLLAKGATGNTEKEMAESLGLWRIWDCGKKRWEYRL